MCITGFSNGKKREETNLMKDVMAQIFETKRTITK